MNLPLMFCCVLVLYPGAVQGSLTPDDSISITVKKTLRDLSSVDLCTTAGQSKTMKVRLWKYNTKSNTTFVRRLVPDAFAACLGADVGQTLPATNFMACSADADKAGLKMFKFMDGVCTGYSFIITLDQQSCLGFGSNAFYINLAANATANRHAKTERSPAFEEQATLRFETMSADVIVDDDGFKGIEGKGLKSDQTYRELKVVNKCQCHYFCTSDSACNAFSVLKLGPNSFLCSLANDNVYTNTPSSMNGSYYAVRADLVELHAIDNLIYKRLDTAVQGFTNQKSACEAVPGYRLVTVKFEAQMPILLELCLGRLPTTATEGCTNQPDWFYVDMMKRAGVLMIQGVLPLADTDVTSVLINDPDNIDHFVYAHSRKLHDESPFKWNTRPVCQANVYGVNW